MHSSPAGDPRFRAQCGTSNCAGEASGDGLRPLREVLPAERSKDVQAPIWRCYLRFPAGAQAAVDGRRRQSGIYELRADESCSAPPSFRCRGYSSVAAEGRVSIERIEDHVQSTRHGGSLRCNWFCTLPWFDGRRGARFFHRTSLSEDGAYSFSGQHGESRKVCVACRECASAI